ncbi:MAG: hypothetical protein LBI04_05855 [Treponema sp.]|nr:hypothetical protein [Treponema sp.]
MAILPLFSCSARINGSLAADGSAAVSVSMALEPRMTSLIRTLSAAGGQDGGQILDGNAIAQSMSVSSAGNVLASFKNTSPSAIEGSVRISDISLFLTAPNAGEFIEFEQRKNGGECKFYIDINNGPVILKLLSVEIAAYLEALMAPLATGEEMTKTEYLELVSSIYSKAISDEIASSQLRASINFPGQITSATGGTFSGKKAEFDIPLLELLVLETPLVYEVNWK